MGRARRARGRQPPGLADGGRADARAARRPRAFADERARRGHQRTSCCSAWAARRWPPRSSAARSASTAGWPRLHVLDSTDAGAVRSVEAAIDLDHALFLVSTKSGGTIETLSLFKHFWSLRAGRQRASSPSPTRARARAARRASTASGAPSSTTPTSAGATARCRTSGSCRRRSWAPTSTGLLHSAGVAEQNCQSFESGDVSSGLWLGPRAGASWRWPAATS